MENNDYNKSNENEIIINDEINIQNDNVKISSLIFLYIFYSRNW